ncbi:MAG: DMT family transporter [Bacillota bacterium]|nr:DMT family transporter [Bacillota bacterium]
MDTHSKGLLAVAAGNVIFGFSFLFSRLALNITIPAVLVAYRFLVAFAVMNILVLIGRNIRKKDGSPLVEFSLKGKPLKNVLLLALFQPVLYFFCETYGIFYTSSAFSGTIIAIIPIMGIVFDKILMHSDIRKKQIVCAFASVAGVIVTTLGAQGMKSSIIGVLFLGGAVCFGALFYVFSKKSAEHYNAIERTYIMFAGASAVFIAFALIQCKGNTAMILEPLGNGTFIIAVIYLAVISSVAAFIFQNWGNNYVTVSEATLFANLTTVISILAGVIFLHEAFTIQQIIGAIAILISVYVANVRK